MEESVHRNQTVPLAGSRACERCRPYPNSRLRESLASTRQQTVRVDRSDSCLPGSRFENRVSCCVLGQATGENSVGVSSSFVCGFRPLLVTLPVQSQRRQELEES